MLTGLLGTLSRGSLPMLSASIYMMGKRLADSDSDDMDDDDEENEKSALIDNGNNSDSIEEAYRSPDSITDTQLGSVSSEKVTSDSGTESEKHVGPEENLSSAQHTDDEDKAALNGDVPSLDASVESGSESLKQENVVAIDSDNVEKKPPTSDLGEDLDAQVNAVSGSKSASTETESLNLENPLSFDDYNSSTEMEVLGMERLKSELQEPWD
ncbi:hypothetical protein Leryth_018978 [Lithospermum erythrorhizon]|nr:hypothetical protein Leryth_018978 [Lithospermum erythrorhizon]